MIITFSFERILIVSFSLQSDEIILNKRSFIVSENSVFLMLSV